MLSFHGIGPLVQFQDDFWLHALETAQDGNYKEQEHRICGSEAILESHRCSRRVSCVSVIS